MYPKAKAPKPPFHPFCWCRLVSRPDLDAEPDTPERKGALQAYLKSLPPHQAARILGNRERLTAVLGGAKLDDVVNAGKDKAFWVKRLGDGGETDNSAVNHLLSSHSFEDFYNNVPGSPERFLVATLTADDQRIFGVKSPNLWLSRTSLDEHIKRHPEVTIEDYSRIPDIVRSADVWGGHRDRRFLLLTYDGKPYRAAIKSSENHAEAWFLSLVISPKQKPPKGAVLLRKGAGGSGWRP